MSESDSDWGEVMSNSPDIGPIEALGTNKHVKRFTTGLVVVAISVFVFLVGRYSIVTIGDMTTILQQKILVGSLITIVGSYLMGWKVENE